MENEVLVSCENIEKSFGRKKVVKGVGLKLYSNKATLLLGHNGAGKTTLCKIVALLSKQTKGKIFFNGKEVEGSVRNEYKKAIGYLSHSTFLYNHLSAYENLSFFARLYQVKEEEKKINSLLQHFDILKVKNEIVKNFSRGMQQRLSLCKLLISDPMILILDEPFTGLDPDGIRNLTKSLSNLKEGRTILLVTHEIDESVEICDEVSILKNGEVVLTSEFKNKDEVTKLYFDVQEKR
jgi:heme ABC exporter ATP-binding subunit CcmA